MKNRTVLIITLVIIGLAATNLYNVVAKDYALYKLESACAMKQVAAGTPRRDVKGCGKADYK